MRVPATQPSGLPARVRVKICGLTRRDDALRAAELGADALGFVFAPRSRRRADPKVVADIVRDLPPFVTAVGVFQDQPLEEVRSLVRECGLSLAQLHGSEDAEYLRALDLPLLKAVSLNRREDLAQLRRYPGERAFLLDTGTGGTGQTFDWAWAVEAGRTARIVLAGGLTPDNVAEAVGRVHPWAVDCCSGTEASVGVKDPEKVRLFIERANGVRDVRREA
ncbi:MAG: phosphoribosylanthranilate isomerase [Proteobacteria bacterium]|nr:phosphoribosylanthranilate isomerase [Pseudomonadota bacterium]